MRKALLLCTGLAAAAAALAPVAAQQAAPPSAAASAVSYTDAGELKRPADYREWVFLSSGLGMTYGPAQDPTGRTQFFDNVFVTREAYRAFMRSGTWPEKTMFVLEGRRAESNVSINNGGRTQGDVSFLEAAVKDSQRFPGGWAYFEFGAGEKAQASAKALPATASCYTCHARNTAVDNTFVQFYPELFEVAKRLGTVKPTYDPTHKP